MSTKLQVVMEASELEHYRQRAEREGLTVSEWVRRALRRAVHGGAKNPKERLQALERALQCEHPTANVEAMLEQIEGGRDLR